jgi:hypothetical protein
MSTETLSIDRRPKHNLPSVQRLAGQTPEQHLKPAKPTAKAQLNGQRFFLNNSTFLNPSSINAWVATFTHALKA